MSHHADAYARAHGCALLLVTCLTACVLLLINRVLIAWAYLLVTPQQWDNDKLHTLALFVGPVLLILPEWWLFDAVSRRVSRLFSRARKTEIRRAVRQQKK